MRYKKGQELFGRTGWREEQPIPIGPVHSMIFEAQSGRRPFRGPFAVLKKEAILSMIEYDMNWKPNAFGETWVQSAPSRCTDAEMQLSV